MRRLAISLSVAAFAILALVATVAAAGPTPSPVQARDTIPTILGLSQAAVMDLRHDGLSLAQIATRQKVDPQKLIDALVAQWSSRIDARVANGGLTTTQAATLRVQLAVQAKATVDQAAPGGMRGAAVGAGPGAMGVAGMGRGLGMGGRGAGAGNGLCDGTGPQASSAP
jgi:hypothetical protein